MKQEQSSLLIRGMSVFAVALVAMLVAGTFADYQIAQAVYTPSNPLGIFFSSLGLLPMAYPACFFLGVLVQRSLTNQKSQVLRIVGAVLCVVFAMAFGALVTRALLSVRDGFGGMAGGELPTMVRLGIGVAVGAGLCAFGYSAGKNNDAKDLTRKLVIVLVALVASYAFIELVKNFIARPRPFAVLAGYDGLEFCPWYQKSSGVKEFMATFGLERDAFKSFPSGHSMQAAAFLISFLGLSFVFPSLREKLGIALAIEIVFTLAVMSCRMIVGAHFLSDVGVGALISVIAFLIVMKLNRDPYTAATHEQEKTNEGTRIELARGDKN
ncbi:MAG: phosphatase PAP2 family protein [Eggerthellaceae bacterium]|nr:phosphatase PAP2 family protein [Eggerthellaceae bacterium]